MTINLVGYALGVGSTDHRSSEAPHFLKRWLQENSELKVFWSAIHEAHSSLDKMKALPVISQTCQSLAKSIHDLALAQKRWVTIGGDHSAAIGTWSGLASAIDDPIGLIWFDAHLDAHTPETSHTHNIHGMPVACLLGHGPSELTHILTKHPKIKPEHIYYIGIRDYEDEEMAFIQAQGIHYYTNKQVASEGIESILSTVVETLSKQTVGFGLSFDVDGLDPKDAPGVATAVPEGVRWHDLSPCLPSLLQHPQLLGLEIVEYNPSLDVDHQTLSIVTTLLELYGA